jgi:hypothetical protein
MPKVTNRPAITRALKRLNGSRTEPVDSLTIDARAAPTPAAYDGGDAFAEELAGGPSVAGAAVAVAPSRSALPGAGAMLGWVRESGGSSLESSAAGPFGGEFEPSAAGLAGGGATPSVQRTDTVDVAVAG